MPNLPSVEAADLLLRGFLAAFFVMLAAVYSAKLAAHAVRDGATPVHRGAPGSAERVRRRVFEGFRAAILVVFVLRAPFPALDALLVPLAPLTHPALTHPAVGAIGAALMLGGFWVSLYAHTYMGALWRSGLPTLDPERPDALLQRGPFARSRNPIFLGVLLCQIGLLLAAPSLFTLACLIAGAWALTRQACAEEASLAARFGPSYLAYRARTPRWI